MKILMTGANARSIGSERVRYDYVQFHRMMRRGLEDLGHEVDMKPVLTQDDLVGYDRALVHVGAPSSLSNGYLPGAALTLAAYGEDARVYVDDWSAERLADDIAAHVEREKGWDRHLQVFRPKEWGRLRPVEVRKARAALLQFLDPVCPYPILGPFFNWGDKTNFFRTGKRVINAIPVALDPSPMMPDPDILGAVPIRRERRWVLATLQNHDKFLANLEHAEGSHEWPVEVLGAAKKAVGGVRAADMPSVVPESQVIERYGEVWGVLSPWYKTAGSGWWRARFNYAAQMGSILFCGDVDGAAIGDSFTNAVDVIEEATTRDLADLADRQAGQLWAHESSRDEFLETLDDFVS